jgi:glutaredoxin
MEMNQVAGTDRGQVRLFTLSTCIWCKKVKALLKDMDVAYQYVDVDLLQGADKENVLSELKQFNPHCSFPSLVVNNSACIVGYDEAKIKEVLNV